MGREDAPRQLTVDSRGRMSTEPAAGDGGSYNDFELDVSLGFWPDADLTESLESR